MKVKKGQLFIVHLYSALDSEESLVLVAESDLDLGWEYKKFLASRLSEHPDFLAQLKKYNSAHDELIAQTKDVAKLTPHDYVTRKLKFWEKHDEIVAPLLRELEEIKLRLRGMGFHDGDGHTFIAQLVEAGGVGHAGLACFEVEL